MNRALAAARDVTGVVTVGLPLAHAALLAAADRPAWPMLSAVAAGLAVRTAAGSTTAVAAALLLAPIWQVLVSPVGAAADFETLAPWLAFLGAALAWPARRGWHSPGAWHLGIAAWALVVSLVTPIVVARELDFTWAAAPWPHLAGIVLVGAGAQLVALLLFDWYQGSDGPARQLAWRALLPGTAAVALVALWQQQIDPGFLSTPFWSGLRRSAGTFFDANASAAWLALTAPVLASSIVRPAALPRWPWRVVCLGLALAAILATGSRSALTALVVIVTITVAATGSVWRWAVAIGVLGVTGWVLTLTPPVADASAGHALGRLADTLRQLLTGGPDHLWALLWGRDGYGSTAMAMIADHPWAGTGPGLFGQFVPGYSLEAAGRLLPPDNAQNWWRHQIAELGLPGAVPATACSLLALWIVVRRPGGAAAPLAGLGLLALMSPPTAHPLLQVIAGMVVAHAVATASPRVEPTRPARGAVAAWGLALICAGATVVAAGQDLRPAHRAMRFHELYSYGVTGVVATPWGEGRWMSPHAAAVLPPTAATLVVRAVVPHDDAAAAPVTVTIRSRHSVACRHTAIDSTPFECRIPAPKDDWMLVRVEVSRSWQTVDGMARAAVVSARFEP